MTIQILTVCSANICRSPLAEYVLRAKLAPLDVPVAVSSAGVSAFSGSPMEPAARALATHWGATETDQHSSQPVTQALVNDAALILTATTGHAATLKNAVRGAATRIFAIREFGAIVTDLDLDALASEIKNVTNGDERFRALVAQVDESRHSSAENFDVPDPFGGDASYYERAQSLMLPGIDAVVALIQLAWPESGAETLARERRWR